MKHFYVIPGAGYLPWETRNLYFYKCCSYIKKDQMDSINAHKRKKLTYSWMYFAFTYQGWEIFLEQIKYCLNRALIYLNLPVSITKFIC